MSRVLPILFNTDMVRAILDGLKSVTRRLGSWKIAKLNMDRNGVVTATVFKETKRGKKVSHFAGGTMNEFIKTFSDYQPGDILYVRESVFQGVGHYLDVSGETVSVLTNDFEYYADGLHEKDHWKDKYERTWMHRRPSIHMPKEAARIWLKVKDVRVERLQEMKPVDVIKEGAYPDCWDCLNTYGESGSQCCYGTEEQCSQCDEVMMEWEKLWNSTIKKSDLDCHGWDANPWVWVIEFERCEKPEEVENVKYV